MVQLVIIITMACGRNFNLIKGAFVYGCNIVLPSYEFSTLQMNHHLFFKSSTKIHQSSKSIFDVWQSLLSQITQHSITTIGVFYTPYKLSVNVSLGKHNCICLVGIDLMFVKACFGRGCFVKGCNIVSQGYISLVKVYFMFDNARLGKCQVPNS